jgi:hypothetical protein
MKVGIGFVNKQNAPYAGQEATHQALQRGRITRSDLVLAFCSGKVDAEGFFRDIQSIVGADAPIVGGSAIGTITNAVISYAGAPAGVLIMQAEELHYSVAATGAVDVDEYQAGQTLVKQLGHNSDDARNAGDALLLLFYDSVKQPATQTSPLGDP